MLTFQILKLEATDPDLPDKMCNSEVLIVTSPQPNQRNRNNKLEQLSQGDEGWKTLMVGHCFFCILENSGKKTGEAFWGLSAPLSQAWQRQTSQYLDAT